MITGERCGFDDDHRITSRKIVWKDRVAICQIPSRPFLPAPSFPPCATKTDKIISPRMINLASRSRALLSSSSCINITDIYASNLPYCSVDMVAMVTLFVMKTLHFGRCFVIWRREEARSGFIKCSVQGIL